MRWIYLSPHLDDAAYSCGGLIWEQSRSGIAVQVLTLCAGDAPTQGLSPFAEQLHARWGTGLEAGERRRQEDIESLQLLGASYWHLPVPDCIYRQNPSTGEHLYPTEESLFGRLHPAENALIASVIQQIEQALETHQQKTEPVQTELVAPLALGGHVDHQLAQAAASRWKSNAPGRSLLYYADYPYVLQDFSGLHLLQSQGWQRVAFPISEAAVQAWVQAIAAHRSQISTFWTGVEDLEARLRGYLDHSGGYYLWKPPEKV